MKTIQVTCALIERDGQVLLAKRPEGKPLAGKWEFPGGKLEAEESIEDCLIREIQEELSCLVQINSVLSPSTHRYESIAIELLPFICELAGSEPQAVEHSAIQWLDLAQLLEHDLAEADIPIAEEYLALRNATHGKLSP